MINLSEETMWQAIVACDSAYDGLFFYGVKTVGVYCRPSCKSRTPLRKNTLFFTTENDAKDAGFRPCKRCRPELAMHDPAAKLAEQARQLFENHYDNRALLAAEVQQLGVTQSHLAVVFRQYYGMAPAQYLGCKREQQAKKMLAETDMSIIDIAADIGFSSLPAFYSFFKRQTGTTPKKFRIFSKNISQ
ncbi:MAG: Ada metal-binding domain-containing protein [Desulfovibrio sp.]|uniref:bifunctional transcriptional activator/DNA repair enzyme AdaA n=1 Tax=Desulfovibrio sp. TaxID=885 RepID=UPI0039E45BBE